MSRAYKKKPREYKSLEAAARAADRLLARRALIPRAIDRGLFPAARRSELKLEVKREVNRNLETKYFDTGINAAVAWSGASWASSEVPCDNYLNASGAAAAYTDSCLLPTANGSGYGQVAGNKYTLKQIRVRGYVRVPVLQDLVDMPGGDTMVRVIMVMDTQPNGAQAQGEDIFQDIGEAPENLFSFMRVSDNLGRFRILRDEMLKLPAIAVGTDGAATNGVGFRSKVFSLQWKPSEPLPVSIRSGNAVPTIAGTVTCNIFLLAAAVGPTAASSAIEKVVTVAASSRAYYTDS